MIEIKTMGELNLTTKDSGLKQFALKIDLKNKLLYFFEENGAKDPVFCVSLDSLVSGGLIGASLS